MTAHRVLGDREHYRRALAFSDEHRRWGRSIYMCDIDAIEYKLGGKITALVEYKLDTTTVPSDYNTTVIAELARMAGVPSWLVLYSADFETLTCTQLTPEHGEPIVMEKAKWVRHLYRLRDLPIPAEWGTPIDTHD